MELPDPIQGGKMELVRGEVVQHMPVNGKHGKRQGRIFRRLEEFTERFEPGEAPVEAGFLVARNPDTVLAPDVSFFPASRTGPGGLPEEGFIPYVPLLAVEVVSPNDRDSDVMEKVDTYLACGVERIWVVRPQRKTVTVYRAGGTARILREDDALTSDDAGFGTPGFELKLAELS